MQSPMTSTNIVQHVPNCFCCADSVMLGIDRFIFVNTKSYGDEKLVIGFFHRPGEDRETKYLVFSRLWELLNLDHNEFPWVIE